MNIQEALQYLSQTIDKRTKQGKAVHVLIKEIKKHNHIYIQKQKTSRHVAIYDKPLSIRAMDNIAENR